MHPESQVTVTSRLGAPMKEKKIDEVIYTMEKGMETGRLHELPDFHDQCIKDKI